jgi:6-pyruvoyltetrahydropterin 2'-reductase
MNKIKIAEIFYSIQGEGLYAGTPSVFLRSFGCNFQCRGFGLPAGERSTEPEDVAKKISLFKIYDDLPLVSTGCDSYASWHPDFKHLSPFMTLEDIKTKMEDLIPNKTWTQANGSDVHLVITGGEPLLGWQRAWPKLIEECAANGLINVTFETNGTQDLDPKFAEWLKHQSDVNVTFSISPKLTCSGETWEDAIQPTVVASYAELGDAYLKFVVSSQQDVEEVDRAVATYKENGFAGQVYLMPIGGVNNLYHLNTKQVAQLSMDKGYKYSPRLQVDIWNNAWGT